jgi:hypothetical protein
VALGTLIRKWSIALASGVMMLAVFAILRRLPVPIKKSTQHNRGADESLSTDRAG